MKLIRGGLLLAVGALVLLVLPPTGWAAFPGANGRIAYSTWPTSSADSHIDSVLPDGTSRERLTRRSGNDWWPAWSATGKRIVFVRQTADGANVLFTMGANGGAQRRVSEEPAYAPHLSPNGRWIVYISGSRSHEGLWKIRTDGTDRQPIISRVDGLNYYVRRAPQYAPNGQRIVFAGAGISTVRPDGTGLRQLTNPGPRYLDQSPDYSPDGQHIAFVRCLFYPDPYADAPWATSCGIYLMRANGSYQRLIHQPDPYAAISSLAYAPAGDRIAFAFWRDYDPSGPIFDAVSNVYTITEAGTDRQAVTHFDGTGTDGLDTLSWQPVPAR